MKSTTVFVVSFTLLISTIAALAQEKGAEYTLVVPLGLMEYEGVGGFATSNRIYGVEVHGKRDWGINFAHVETTSFEKISRTDNGLVEYEFRVDGRWMKLRVPAAAVFEQFAAPGSEEGDAAQRLVDAAVERLSETTFGGTDIPRESWRAVLATMVDNAAVSGYSPVCSFLGAGWPMAVTLVIALAVERGMGASRRL